MSREVIIRIRDDVDGVSDADETIVFGYRGESYEIDLHAHNVELFDKDMKPWLESARKIVPEAPVAAAVPRRRQSSPAVPRKVIQQRKDIRNWANASGFNVNDRGMIAAVVIDAFQTANPSVTLLPGVAGNYEQRKSPPPDVVTSVRAQDAEDGLISAASLLQKHYDGTARDRHGEKLGKKQRDTIRAWAQENGIEQARTGHLRREVLDAYYAANPDA